MIAARQPAHNDGAVHRHHETRSRGRSEKRPRPSTRLMTTTAVPDQDQSELTHHGLLRPNTSLEAASTTQTETRASTGPEVTIGGGGARTMPPSPPLLVARQEYVSGPTNFAILIDNPVFRKKESSCALLPFSPLSLILIFRVLPVPLTPLMVMQKPPRRRYGASGEVMAPSSLRN
jgi:hypothetical protein